MLPMGHKTYFEGHKTYCEGLEICRKMLAFACPVIFKGMQFEVGDLYDKASNTKKKRMFNREQQRKLKARTPLEELDIHTLCKIIQVFGSVPSASYDRIRYLNELQNAWAHDLPLTSMDKKKLSSMLDELELVATQILDELKEFCDPALIPSVNSYIDNIHQNFRDLAVKVKDSQSSVGIDKNIRSILSTIVSIVLKSMVVFISTTAAIWIVERICMDQNQDQIDNQRPQIYQGEFVIMTEEDFDPTDMKIKNEIEDSVKAVIQRIYGENGPTFTVTGLKKGCMHVGFIYETNEESQAVLAQIEKVLGGAKLPGKVSNISINNGSSDVTQVQIKINIRLFRNKLEEMLKVLMQYHGHNLIIIVVVTIIVVVNTGIVYYPPTFYTVYIWTAVGITLAGAGAWVSDAMGTKYAKNNIIQYGKEVKDQLEEYEKGYRVNIEYSVNILSFKMIYEEIESDNIIGEEVLVHLKEIILPVLTAAPTMIATLSATVASIIAAEMRTDIVTRLRAFIESISFSNATTIVILSPVPIGVAYAIYTSVCEHPSI